MAEQWARLSLDHLNHLSKFLYFGVHVSPRSWTSSSHSTQCSFRGSTIEVLWARCWIRRCNHQGRSRWDEGITLEMYVTKLIPSPLVHCLLHEGREGDRCCKVSAWNIPCRIHIYKIMQHAKRSCSQQGVRAVEVRVNAFCWWTEGRQGKCYNTTYLSWFWTDLIMKDLLSVDVSTVAAKPKLV